MQVVLPSTRRYRSGHTDTGTATGKARSVASHPPGAVGSRARGDDRRCAMFKSMSVGTVGYGYASAHVCCVSGLLASGRRN